MDLNYLYFLVPNSVEFSQLQIKVISLSSEDSVSLEQLNNSEFKKEKDRKN